VIRRALQRLRGLRPSEEREQELREELEAHLQLATDDHLRAGLGPAEARRAAVLELGGLEATREAVRDARTVPVLADLLRDARLGLRQLRRRPLFGATAVFVLALGLAASVALFAFADAALLRPLPYADPGSLVRVYESTDSCPLCNLSYPDFKDWKEQARAFSGFDLFRGTTVGLDAPGGPEAARVALVSAGFFRTLGVAPALGRDFAPGEDVPSAPPVVVLPHRTWQVRYGGDPGMVGRTVRLDGQPHTVIGVMPPSFAFAPSPAEFYAPFTGTDSCGKRRSCHNAHSVARLRPGVTLAAALDEVRAIAARLEQQYPDSNRGQGAAVAPLAESVVGRVRPVLLLLLSGALLLFAIAAFNVTGLLVVRAETRRRELAVRTAMGASGARLLGQFATEAAVLVGTGGVLGLGLAFVFMKLLVGLLPTGLWAQLPFFHDLGLGPRVVGFGGVLALASLVLFTLAPWLLVRQRPLEGLAGGRGSSGTVWRRLGSRLVIAELATAMVLLVGAGLLGRSLTLLLQVELGLRPEGLAVVEVRAEASDLETQERFAALVRRMRDEVASVPGVASVGVTSTAPVGTSVNSRWFRIVGRAYPGDGHEETPFRSVSPGYFQTLGTPLLSGRDFDERDLPDRPRVAIVNATLARQMFPGESPLGRRLVYVAGGKEELEIVGVVADVREGALDAALTAAVYHPLTQDTSSFMSVLARASGPERGVLPGVVAALRRASPGFVVREQTTMSTRIGNSPAAYFSRSTAWLAGVFAALALVLSAVGLHGVVAYSVGQRTREIAIRMALGAQRGSVQGMVLREAGLMVVAGLAVGAVAAALGARTLESLLFQVRPSDPWVGAGVTGVLALVALVAVAVPARRAASVHPMEALRTD
jgi:macrolide transport system ATP-binding/permease protein